MHIKNYYNSLIYLCYLLQTTTKFCAAYRFGYTCSSWQCSTHTQFRATRVPSSAHPSGLGTGALHPEHLLLHPFAYYSHLHSQPVLRTPQRYLHLFLIPIIYFSYNHTQFPPTSVPSSAHPADFITRVRHYMALLRINFEPRVYSILCTVHNWVRVGFITMFY